MANQTEKYKFIVSVDQFGHEVDSHYCDTSENILIDAFEDICLSLKDEGQDIYHMIELGSNQCYYSLLFKHIIGKSITENILIEPQLSNYERGQNEFKINGCDGTWYRKAIGAPKCHIKGMPFDVNTITLKEVFDNHNINKLDVLHSDIDGAESSLLDSEYDFFNEHKVKNIFLCTHSLELHSECKQKLEGFGYKIILDESAPSVGCDRLIIATSVV
jgi:hypothetical protein